MSHRFVDECMNLLRPSGAYDSDNGLAPEPLSEPISVILLIGPLGPNFSEILIELHTFSFK